MNRRKRVNKSARQSRPSVRAFTLIELLITIAIILILIAIALPNFLEAMTRAKVTRAKSELRSLVTAIQAYSNDYDKAIPLASDERGLPIDPYPPVGLGPEVFETRISSGLTTPVAYLTEIPEDPFASDAPDDDDPRIFESLDYHYGSREYALANNGPEGGMIFEMVTGLLGGPSPSILYVLGSHGPDRDHDDDEDALDIDAALTYSPTNGSDSNGDICYLGPSHGFSR